MREIYFLTSTITRWVRLFKIAEHRNTIIESLDFSIATKRIILHGFVIMPNHVHLMVSVTDRKKLSAFLRDFHKFTAQKIIRSIELNGDPLIESLRSTKRDRKKQVWQTTHAIKRVETYDFFRQKLEYMHGNPCQARWRLAERPERYEWSSASAYIHGKRGLLDVVILGPTSNPME